MTVAVVASLIGLLAVVVALLHDRPLGEARPSGPRWSSPPSPEQVTRVSFPLAFRGYDPAHVEAHLDAVRRAYEQLLSGARPHPRAHPARPGPGVPGATAAPRHGSAAAATGLALAASRSESDREALRTAVALSRLEQPRADASAHLPSQRSSGDGPPRGRRPPSA